MPSNLEVGVLMFTAYRSAENRIFEAIRHAGYTDITLAQARIAARIGPNGTRLTDLAEQAQVAKQTAKFLVDQLERAGYVERIVDPNDKRARLIRIVGRGIDILPIARAEEARIQSEWTEHLGKPRMDQLRESLLLLRSITDPYAAEGKSG
ncbi:MarR family transcriptional regulator [Rhodococcus sp. SRB_17]|uniref:MarR family winged helix-turn-helix transcriptional regulator n=1 Tax=Rhodococcus sp. OK302 TaxID=1882769 RepID=UPI000B93B253|nr:MarR family transcriptional regulator [Rhodococcus sp. OK302]NMM91998.1 MarR family transcriptional regulator [Rhodococcus sp. SRB_17]OYD69049.1 DNA-binding MarR family transcriptional regulator [Rhodococcus sp. OK302]